MDNKTGGPSSKGCKVTYTLRPSSHELVAGRDSPRTETTNWGQQGKGFCGVAVEAKNYHQRYNKVHDRRCGLKLGNEMGRTAETTGQEGTTEGSGKKRKKKETVGQNINSPLREDPTQGRLKTAHEENEEKRLGRPRKGDTT